VLQDHPSRQQQEQEQQDPVKPAAASRAAQSRRRCLDFSSADATTQRASLLSQHELQEQHAREAPRAAALPGSQGLRQMLPGMSMPMSATISTFIPANHQQQQGPGVQLDCNEQLPHDGTPAAQQQPAAALQPTPGQADPATADAAAEDGSRPTQQRQLRQRKADTSKTTMQELYEDMGCEDDDDESDPDAEEWAQEQMVLLKQRRSQRSRRHVPARAQPAAAEAPAKPAAAQEQQEQEQQQQQGGQQQQPAGSSSRPVRSSRAAYLARADAPGSTPDRRLSFASGTSLGVLAPYTPDDRSSK
jgi:hypothetical protein